MKHHNDISGIAIKNATINQREQIAKICAQKNISALRSITEPDITSIKAHPHVQYHSKLVDSFRGRHPNFVSFDNFITSI